MASMSEDDELLAELGAAVRAGEGVPASFRAAGRAAFAWRNIDAELATLGFDSAAGAAARGEDAPVLAGTRAERATLRALTFVASGITIELELTPDALLGQVVPPQPGEVELQTPDGGARPATIDDVGWFAFRPAPAGMCRLRLRTAQATTPVLTEWITVSAAG